MISELSGNPLIQKKKTRTTDHLQRCSKIRILLEVIMKTGKQCDTLITYTTVLVHFIPFCNVIKKYMAACSRGWCASCIFAGQPAREKDLLGKKRKVKVGGDLVIEQGESILG